MKKSESISTLEEALDIESHKGTPRRDYNPKEESLSEEIPPSVVKDITKTSPVLTRLTSRFSTAFRSLRGTASTSKRSETHLKSDEEYLSLQNQDEVTPKRKKKKLKLSKFSFSGIKRNKVNPRKTPQEETLVSTSTQTSDTLTRRGKVFDSSNQSELSSSEVKTKSLDTRKSEKVRKIQITISGKKIGDSKIPASDNYLPPRVSLERYEARSEKSTILLKPNVTVADNQREGGKTNVTQSTLDTPPNERAPPPPSLASPKSTRASPGKNGTGGRGGDGGTSGSVSQRFVVVQITPPLSPRSVDGNRRGAVRKNPRLQRQKSREEFLESEVLMRRETNLDRGRRFPRPSNIENSPTPQRRQQQSPTLSTSPLSGNNLQNPNISGSIADRLKEVPTCSELKSPTKSVKDTEISPTRNISPEVNVQEQSQSIRFSIGKSVRSRQITVIHNVPNSSQEQSSFESNKSSRSQSPVSDTSSTGRRRRIRYIDQPTFYTDEEKEILEGKRQAFTGLTGISEYSLDSDISCDQMPAFGDLTMEHEGPPIMTSSTEKREHLYKILVIGELGTGKTSFIKRYVHQFFSQSYRATIGVDFALKVLHWDPNTIIRLQLWDIAGQERFGNMTRVYYKEAVGAFIVFDVTRNATFDAVIKWKQDLDSKVQLPDGSPIPCILLANKCDQQKQGIITTPEKMDEYVQENGFAGWFETSAKENINIEDAARALVNKILLNDKLVNAGDIMDNEKFALAGGSSSGTAQSTSQGTERTCSC